jgi:hypothetical protein
MYSVAAMANEGFGTSRDARLAQAMYRSTAERGFVPAMVRVVKWNCRAVQSGHDVYAAVDIHRCAR